MQPWSRDYAGTFEEHELESDALRGNRLGDPHVRPLWVYTPPGYARDEDRRLPSIFLIQGHTGQIDMWRNRSAFRPNVLELFDKLFADEGCPPALVVFVDAWTSYGGSQFLDSPSVGNYHTYLCEEVVPFVDARYATLPDAAHRGIGGKSSGGSRAPGRRSRRRAARAAGDLHRRGQARPVLPRPRRGGLPESARAHRRHGRLLRALRRDAFEHRVSVSPRAALSRRASPAGVADARAGRQARRRHRRHERD